MPADDRVGFEDEDTGLPVIPDRAEPGPDKPVSGQFRALHGALQHAYLRAQREDLQLKGSSPRPGSCEGNDGPENRAERKPPMNDNPQFIRLSEVYENHSQSAGGWCAGASIDKALDYGVFSGMPRRSINTAVWTVSA